VLFTTATFVFVFLPVVLAGYFWLGARSPGAAAAWLFVASVFFYGYWVPEFTLLLLMSIGANYFIGTRIVAARASAGRDKVWLILGVAFNLGLLGYFKYANFFVDSLNTVLKLDWQIARVLLPIGISFYSFTQIAYLVDTWQGKVREAKPVHYGLFVTYFPHLIAGPVLHHAQMMPQFADRAVYRFNLANAALGLFVFALGLLKKVVLADGIAPYADAVFNAADAGHSPGQAEAWLGALAYTFQLYFDFSGYSDMAIGLSWMFNIRLPFNFDSPYKAVNISDFWRRWHISLSTFLRDYLYVPLGGNRRGPVRRYLNLAATMVLGGLWHGASWTFVFWGALHGAYLMVNHAFAALVGGMAGRRPAGLWRRIGRVSGWALTFVCVIVGWVFFRAQTFAGAAQVLQSMVGVGPAAADPGALLWNAGLSTGVAAGWCLTLGAIALLLPNSNRVGDAVGAWIRASNLRAAAVCGAMAVAVVLLVVVNTTRDTVSAFIYFNF
jgi:alginate O-acetyltransferase complex protein AlgI